MKSGVTDEALGHSTIRMGSDRNFGFVFAGAFSLFAAVSLWNGTGKWPFLLAIAVAFVVVTLLAPHWLRPLNRLWHRFGLLLGRIVSPIVMGTLFFVVVTPVATLARLFGNDPLRLKRDPEAVTYWIERTPPGPEPQTMRNQF